MELQFESGLTRKIVAAFRGMHVSPAKHSYASVTDRQTDRRTDRQTDDGQSDPYVSLCFAGDTKSFMLSKRFESTEVDRRKTLGYKCPQ